MSQLPRLEASYQSLINSLPRAIPDGVIQINLELLHSLNLLDQDNKLREKADKQEISFEVNEGPDKLTLYNDQFVIWIIPQFVDSHPTTFALIALNNVELPILELAFAATGIYNSSKIVLRVLNHYLHEIYENETMIRQLKEGSVGS